MPCYRPRPAGMTKNWLKPQGWNQPRLLKFVTTSDGSRLFAPQIGDHSCIRSKQQIYKFTTLPCNICFGCRCDNARMWSLRMMHEARYHETNYFITLTYSNENLPAGADLNYKHLDLFWKNARHHFQTAAKPFKYFACGEYGDKTLRPHYHFAGYDFKITDLRPFKRVDQGWYYISESLREIWKHGHVIVAPLEWDSAAYIARYVTKKMHGQSVRYMDTFDPDTGEVDQYTIERAFQSKGLGLPWYLDNEEEIWNLDGCLYKNDYLVKPPRYYFKQLEKRDPARAIAIKESRLKSDPLQFIDQQKDRELIYAMEVKRLHMQTLKRNL